MKQWIFGILLLLSSTPVFAIPQTDNDFDVLAFAEWYDNNPFTLGDGRSVNPMQIFDNYHPVDLMEAINIQAKLLTDKTAKK